MMGPRQVGQAALFDEFSLERHVPVAHVIAAERTSRAGSGRKWRQNSERDEIQFMFPVRTSIPSHPQS